MRSEIFSLCDFAQEAGGKLTVVGTFDTIMTHSFPCVHPQFHIVVRLRFNIGEFAPHSFRVECRNLDGEAHMPPFTGSIDVKGVGNATAVSHLVFCVNNLRFERPDVISFVLYIDDREISSIPMYIRKG